jgi:hypothetical protein
VYYPQADTNLSYCIKRSYSALSILFPTLHKHAKERIIPSPDAHFTLKLTSTFKLSNARLARSRIDYKRISSEFIYLSDLGTNYLLFQSKEAEAEYQLQPDSLYS